MGNGIPAASAVVYASYKLVPFSQLYGDVSALSSHAIMKDTFRAAASKGARGRDDPASVLSTKLRYAEDLTEDEADELLVVVLTPRNGFGHVEYAIPGMVRLKYVLNANIRLCNSASGKKTPASRFERACEESPIDLFGHCASVWFE